MGWWETYDNTVIGDELADIVGEELDAMVNKLVAKFPTITREQVLHTLAFCSGYFKPLDDSKKEVADDDKMLVVMTVKQREEWREQQSNPPDMSKRIAPETELMNVHNPFTGAVV